MNKNTTSRTSVKIVVCGYTKQYCLICGDLVDDPGVIAHMEIDGENGGDVCPACLEAGPIGAIERQKAHIAQTNSWLNFQTRLTELLANTSPDTWATLDDLRKSELELELGVRGLEPEQLAGKTLEELKAMSDQFQYPEPVTDNDDIPF